MVDSQAVNMLRDVYFLLGLGDAELQRIAGELKREEYDPGEVIMRQGAPADALFLILQGEVSVEQGEAERPSQELARLTAGDVVGEMGLFFNQPRNATVRAIRATSVYRWDRESVLRFMESHPQALNHLKFSAMSRQLAHEVEFPWLAEDEVIYGLARKHRFILITKLLLPAAFLVIALGALWWRLNGGVEVAGWIGGVLALFSLLFSVWRWIDWGNDYYVVTDRRVVWLEKVVGLYDSRQEAPLHMVLSVSVSTDALGRAIGFGDVVVRTYTSQVRFRDIGNPYAMAAMVEEHWRRVRYMKEHEDRTSLVKALRNRLDGGEPPEEVAQPPSEKPPRPERPIEPIGLGHWTFQVRFEEKGIITYRKHWAVLLRRIALPSIAVLTLVGLIGARLSGLIQLFSLSSYLVGALVTLIPATLWWVYQYVDWANDIYQVTPTQIVDVYKKPLARELRKVAPLENILGTEVERKGVIGLLLNYGDVIAEVGTTKFSFDGVFDPNGVQQDIVRAQEAFLERKRQVERKRRQEEMVEWFSIYHDELGSRQADPQRSGRRPEDQGGVP